MKKLIEVLVLVSLGSLLLGCLLIPSNPMFWLATPNPIFMVMQLGLITFISIFSLLGVPPLRRLRLVLAVFASVLCYWALSQTYNNTLPLLDGLAFAGAGIVLLIQLFEADHEQRSVSNWEYIVMTFKPVIVPIERMAAVYALLAIVLVGLLTASSNIEHHYLTSFT